MCVYSFVADHYFDKWKEYIPHNPLPNDYDSGITIAPYIPMPDFPQEPQLSDEELKEFRELLRKAREYDKKNNEPDCELEDKKKRLIKLAEELGVKEKVEEILRE